MSNSSVEAFRATRDKLLLPLSVILVVLGVMLFYMLSQKAFFLRVGVLIFSILIASGIALISQPGKNFVSFTKDAYREVGKVVWPSRKEATQATAIVFAFVLIMSLYLWLTDKSIEWLVFSLILGWK
ncbi:preprotein translocase subunit SecE [Candidatus Pandoraea novymonadis]|uniref:Protein translocase subunit SecE n=1 Tax=Candidatus Pandoraea novymonadis TaxID=1808959 RepID=A0ABX5FE08_9BURK|nr:preprotein translocase subunit SecE [Candidatus Pandoraea novymonadis]PSB91693.1 Protein translocase subunit SecE [Candidatus Pandoraea novymonadis]